MGWPGPQLHNFMQRRGRSLQIATATLKQLSRHAMEKVANFPVFNNHFFVTAFDKRTYLSGGIIAAVLAQKLPNIKNGDCL